MCRGKLKWGNMFLKDFPFKITGGLHRAVLTRDNFPRIFTIFLRMSWYVGRNHFHLSLSNTCKLWGRFYEIPGARKIFHFPLYNDLLWVVVC